MAFRFMFLINEDCIRAGIFCDHPFCVHCWCPAYRR